MRVRHEQSRPSVARPRRARRWSTAVLVALAVALALASSVSASPTQVTTLEPASYVLRDDTREETLDDVLALGVRHLRVLLQWRDVAPAAFEATRPAFDATDPEAYDWGRYDRLFQATRARGMRIALTISGPAPRWATRDRTDHVTRPSPAEFGRFATAVGRRYRNDVRAWSIWNEPNLEFFLKPQFAAGRPVAGQLYRALFIAGERGLTASGNGSDTILMGETAPGGRSDRMAPIPFLQQVLCLDRRFRPLRGCPKLAADGWAHHPYSFRPVPVPFYRPPDPGNVSLGVLARLESALDRAAALGRIRARMPIHVTEYGLQSYPDTLLGVPTARQAEYLSLSELIAWADPRVHSFSQYLIRDDDIDASPGSRYGGFESGLRFADGRKKPAYDAFRLPLVAVRDGSAVRLWGRVRGARRPVVVRVLSGPCKGGGARAPIKSAVTDAGGVWTSVVPFKPRRCWSVRATGGASGGAIPKGPPVHSFALSRFTPESRPSVARALGLPGASARATARRR